MGRTDLIGRYGNYLTNLFILSRDFRRNLKCNFILYYSKLKLYILSATSECCSHVSAGPNHQPRESIHQEISQACLKGCGGSLSVATKMINYFGRSFIILKSGYCWKMGASDPNEEESCSTSRKMR